MRIRLYIFLFLSLTAVVNCFAQDKLFLKDGKKINCKVLSINPTTIDYLDSTSAQNAYTLQKSDVLMAELKNGEVYIFGNELPTVKPYSPAKTKTEKVNAKKAAIREKEKDFKNGIIGFQPIDIVWGRLTFCYERLFMDKRMGIAVPISLTYDARILMPNNSNDTIVQNTRDKVRYNTGIITGLDLNYYYETRSHTKFFFGPRFRYGTDVNLANITAYTVQFQNGFLLCDAKGKMATTFAFGFGFARLISVPFSSRFPEKQSYPWMSFTLRIGLRR
ncbi:MAG: hypothetical protein KA163_08685 [Bacteroidia bacterium]|nr:hypothetical protein [Bacteroidia bacterium]